MSSKQYVYEVHVSVPVASNAAYVAYMTSKHIPDIFRTGKFSDIRMTTAADHCLGPSATPADVKGEAFVHYKTAYLAKSRDALESYLRDDAPALRDDFMKHCPKNAKISRRVWQLDAMWSSRL